MQFDRYTRNIFENVNADELDYSSYKIPSSVTRSKYCLSFQLNIDNN